MQKDKEVSIILQTGKQGRLKCHSETASPLTDHPVCRDESVQEFALSVFPRQHVDILPASSVVGPRILLVVFFSLL
jgi:hypothetical protein